MIEQQMQNTLLSDQKTVTESKTSSVNKGKVVFKPYNQTQQVLLPKNVEDYVGHGHIARLISMIIDGMDIRFITETYKGGGTSAYDPRMLLKVWILGFIYKIYSCRLLAKELRENLAFIWISGNQTPDFRTLNNFRLRLKEDIKKIFKKIVEYALEEGIINGKDIFFDHTKRESNANKHKVVWRKNVERYSKMIAEELDKLFKYIDELNEMEGKLFKGKDLSEQMREGFNDKKVQELIDKVNKKVKKKKITLEKGRKDRKKVRRVKELLDRKKKYAEKKEVLGERNSYSKTDKDAVAMRMKDQVTTRPAYNEGIATEKGFVINYVVSNNPADNVSFIPLAEGAIDNLGKTPENANADAAYGNEENHKYIEKKRIKNFLKYNIYHKEKSKKWRDERLRLQDFTYDKKKDEFRCKKGIKLSCTGEQMEITKTRYKRKVKTYRAEEGNCPQCPLQDKCTKAKARTLSVSWEAERLKQQAKINLDSEKGRELRKRRGNEVESVFGDEKLNKGKYRYHLRGLEKVNIEAGLYYISHNIRKIQTITKQKRINQIQKTDKRAEQTKIPAFTAEVSQDIITELQSNDFSQYFGGPKNGF